MLKQYSHFFKSLMLLHDLLFLSLAWWMAYLLRFRIDLFPSPEPYLFRHYFIGWLMVLVIWGLVFVLLDLYRSRRISTRWREIADIFKGSFLGLLVFLGILFFLHEIALSRIVVVLFWLLSLGLLAFSHAAFREGLRFFRRRGYNVRHILVVGSPDHGTELVRKLRSHRHLGLNVVGVHFIGDYGSAGDVEGVKIVRNQEDLLDLARSGSIDQVFIALRLEDFSKLRQFGTGSGTGV